jgi:hypothetical protein
MGNNFFVNYLLLLLLIHSLTLHRVYLECPGCHIRRDFQRIPHRDAIILNFSPFHQTQLCVPSFPLEKVLFLAAPYSLFASPPALKGLELQTTGKNWWEKALRYYKRIAWFLPLPPPLPPQLQWREITVFYYLSALNVTIRISLSPPSPPFSILCIPIV